MTHFQRTAILLAIAVVLFASSPVLAVCTQHGNATASSSPVVGSNDIAGIEGRNFFMIQNTGGTNGMNVAIGSNNNAGASDMYLAPGVPWVMVAQNGKRIPGGDVAVYSASGTSWAFCDF
jgi:hypothetical protein